MARFVPSGHLESELAKQLEFHAMLKRKADAVEAEAKRIARSEAYDRGSYHDSIKAEVGHDDTGRLVGRVNAADFKAWWVEAGTAGRPPKAVLRRALEARSHTP